MISFYYNDIMQIDNLNPKLKDLMKTAIFILALALLAIIASCNTMHGIGKDLEAGGRTLQNISN